MATITPFRYPGAKNKLLPILREYLDPIIINHNSFIDVFVGGGSVLLDIAQRYPVVKLYANDKDQWMFHFWNVVSGDDENQFKDLLRLINQKPTLQLFYDLKNTPTTNPVECAYRAIFFNRTTFSGIFYSGPIGGKEQKSKYTVDCRYNSEKLKKKIQFCRKLLIGRTIVTGLDFADYSDLWNTDIPAYLDPPYYVKGDVLYIEKMDSFQHEKLAALIQYRENWVMSYDDCPEIRSLYSNNKIIDLPARYSINGKKDSWKSKNELIILPE
jgi:DNA adenine methylase